MNNLYKDLSFNNENSINLINQDKIVFKILWRKIKSTVTEYINTKTSLEKMIVLNSTLV